MNFGSFQSPVQYLQQWKTEEPEDSIQTCSVQMNQLVKMRHGACRYPCIESAPFIPSRLWLTLSTSTTMTVRLQKGEGLVLKMNVDVNLKYTDRSQTVRIPITILTSMTETNSSPPPGEPVKVAEIPTHYSSSR
ncbi:hypothetical protein BDD12DRAFT_808469 [Trichophaea hybrida]|nr:hypothetical protein BDD12DRAFT_808469 [Trichophaea hybrida]